MTRYEKIFLEQALVGYPDFRKSHKKVFHWKENMLTNRRNMLNRKFKFTRRNIERLDDLNKLLAEKELWAYRQARRLEKLALKEMQKKGSPVSDYEIEFKVSLFSEKKFKGIEEMEGNPFYEDKIAITFMKYQSDTVRQKDSKEIERNTLKENHNEFQHSDQPPWRRPHPLKNQHHCYLFHHLYDHTFLAWQDLLDIDEIWIEVKLRIQRITKIKGKKHETIFYK